MDGNMIGLLLPYYLFTAIIAAMCSGTIVVIVKIIGGIVIAITKSANMNKGLRSRFVIIIFAIFFIPLSISSTSKVVNQKRKAEKLVSYCEKYRQEYGGYPEKLENLVPEFIDRGQFDGQFAKYRYHGSAGHYFLWYWTGAPFQTNNYYFDEKKWHVMD